MVARCMQATCRRAPVRARGLCARCYAAALRLVLRDRVTWEQLEKAGRVATATHRGRRLGPVAYRMLQAVGGGGGDGRG